VKDADKLGIKCNEFGGNLTLICFYILYCCYFWVSAMQIREGVPEIKKGSFMMNSYSVVNKLAFQGFMAIPFLFELKTFVDWTFTKTALDVFQWFILTATHAELFVAKCVQGRY
jgi:piezo-type mechanosensitive ion channel component 1/2